MKMKSDTVIIDELKNIVVDVIVSEGIESDYFSRKYGDSLEKVRSAITVNDVVPALGDFGDFAFPCFKLAPVFKKSPKDIAEDICEGINKSMKNNNKIADNNNVIENKIPNDSKIANNSKITKDYSNDSAHKRDSERLMNDEGNEIHEEKKNKSKIYDGLNTELFSSVSAVNGYVNFTLNKALLLKSVYERFISNGFLSFSDKKEKIMVEYSSPNTNKPLHMGHLRNNVLGMAVSNLLKTVGYDVVRSSLYNDRGIGVSEVIYQYMKYHDGEVPNIKPDHYVGKLYSEFNVLLKEKPQLYDEVKEVLKKWEAKDPEIINRWKKLRSFVLEGYKQTYNLLGSEFDVEYFESDIYEEGKKIVLNGVKKGIFKRLEDGAVIAPLEDFGLPNRVLIKSDGTSLYVTNDIYLAKKKFDDFKLSKSIYVVASEQDLYFKQLFKILDLLKMFDNVNEKLYHLSYGLVSLPNGRLKSREGTSADIDDIYNEVFELAKKEIVKRENNKEGVNELNSNESENYKDYDDDNDYNERASKVSLAAIKFFILKIDPVRNMVYVPEESIAFDGETGPYLLYTYARIKSILRKMRIDGFNDIKAQVDSLNIINNIDNSNEKILSNVEKKIVFELARFSDVIRESAVSYKPNILARFLIGIAQQYNNFYHQYKIINEDDDSVKWMRVLLSYLVSEVIKEGLNLLNIEPIEKM